MDLTASTALVTGGAVRIGAAICEMLAAQGCGVVVHCDKSEGPARRLADKLAGQGARAWVVPRRLDSAAACERLVADAFDAAGNVNILVNNAGKFARQDLLSASENDLSLMVRENCLVAAWLTRSFAGRTAREAGLRRAESGRPLAGIVNLLDSRIAGPDAECVPYAVSKSMLAGFTRAAAMELAPAITVNAVAPGPVLLPPRQESGAAAPIKAGPMLLAGRPTPDSVASAVVFLLESDYITGQILYVDGGQHLLIA